jgi:hypothetical protein
MNRKKEAQIELGEYLKDEGIQRSAERAEKAFPTWNDRAYNYLERFISSIRSPFMTEDVRECAEERGLPKPPNLKAWGHIVISAKKNGLIKSVGIGKRSEAQAHRAYATLWQRATL